MAVIWYTVDAAQFLRKRDENLVCVVKVFYLCDFGITYICIVSRGMMGVFSGETKPSGRRWLGFGL